MEKVKILEMRLRMAFPRAFLSAGGGGGGGGAVFVEYLEKFIKDTGLDVGGIDVGKFNNENGLMGYMKTGFIDFLESNSVWRLLTRRTFRRDLNANMVIRNTNLARSSPRLEAPDKFLPPIRKTILCQNIDDTYKNEHDLLIGSAALLCFQLYVVEM